MTVTYALSGNEFGHESERDLVFELQRRFDSLLQRDGIGELDGNLFGDGEVEIYLYGSDGVRMWQVIESAARAFRLRPAQVELVTGSERRKFAL